MQYNLTVLLLSVVAFAVVFGLMFQAPHQIACPGLVLIVFAFSALAIVGARSRRPDISAFFCGALIPLAVMLFFIAQHLHGFLLWFGEAASTLEGEDAIYWNDGTLALPGVSLLLGAGILLSVVLGFLCAGFRRLIDGDQ